MKKAVVYIPRETPCLFEEGKKARYYGGGAAVDNIVIANGDLVVYFDNNTYVTFSDIPYEYHGITQRDF